MRAITVSNYGACPSLTELPTPQAGPGQVLIAVQAAGTYAKYVACREDAPLARIPAGLDPVTAAGLPTAGGTGMAIAESLALLDGETALIVGAAGAQKSKA